MKYATLIVSLIITIAVLIPGSNLPEVGLRGLDKLVHIGLFGLWAVAVRYDFNAPDFRFLLVFFAGAVFSIVTEVLQLLVEGRSFDAYDMVADAVGLICGLAVSGKVLQFLRKTK